MVSILTNPFFSIIIAVYNKEDTLRQALHSVLNQTWTSTELIIIDGGSTDKSVPIIKEYKDKIAYWESEPDRGIYHAWNKALAKAKGRWVLFLGADDYLWDEKVLENVAARLSSAEESILLAYGLVNVVNAQGSLLFTVGTEWSAAKLELNTRMSICHTGVFHKRDLFKKYGLFDDSLKISADYDLMLRVTKYEDALFLNGCVIAGMRLGGISSNRKTKLLHLKEKLIVKKRHGQSVLQPRLFKQFVLAYLFIFLESVVGAKKAVAIENYLRRLFNKAQING